MADNLKYGLYDRSEVVPGYFGAPATAGNDDRLRELGLFDEDETAAVSGLLGEIKEASEPSFGEKAKEFASGLVSFGSSSSREGGGEEEREEFKKTSKPAELIGGIAEKTAGSFTGGLERIQEAGEGIATGEFDIDEGLIRGGAGALQTFFSPVAGVLGEGVEQGVKQLSDDFKSTVLEGVTPTIQSVTKWYDDQSPEQRKQLDNIGVSLEVLLEFAGGKAVIEGLETGVKKSGELIESGREIVGEGVETLKQAIPDISLPKKDKESDLLKKLDLQTSKGTIDGVEVDIPKVDKGIVETLSGPVREKDTKVLAGRALSPRTVGKSAKQKLKSIQDVEKNANNFYKNIRTGVIEGDISTIESASQSVIDNIDTIGARIGEAVKKVDGSVSIDNDIADSIITALNAKGSSVSPATTILRKFLDDLGNGTLSITDAFELKKAYGNEVTKLYKSGDSGTKQFKALSDGVKSINKQIDEIIDNQLGDQFANDKAVFRNLKLIVDDIVASTLVEGRRSPNTFAEQIGMIEGLLSPVDAIKQTFIKEIGELNTRGGAWKELIKIYDQKALSDFKK